MCIEHYIPHYILTPELPENGQMPFFLFLFEAVLTMFSVTVFVVHFLLLCIAPTVIIIAVVKCRPSQRGSQLTQKIYLNRNWQNFGMRTLPTAQRTTTNIESLRTAFRMPFSQLKVDLQCTLELLCAALQQHVSFINIFFLN